MHVDADVLDGAILPAVDYRLPDGLSWDELTTAMRIAVESHRLVGLDLTIYNPTLDPDGVGARGLVSVITDAFA
jgi:arginase